MATATAVAAPVATAGAPVKKAPKQLPAPNSDFYQLVDVLTAEEKAIVKKVRTYMETKVQPIINKYWSDDAFPFELLPSFKELGLGGLGFEGYGCAGGSQKLFGFVAMEIARTDASFCTFWGVHSGLAMGSIYLDGSEEQKQKWLPPMARFEKIGCFGLTEPLVGSGTSRGMLTTAKREGDTWVLNGQKRWIGNAPWCDISIIWARDVADNQVKGFIVENKTTPGFSVEKIEHKIALKVVQNGQITLKDVRVPEATPSDWLSRDDAVVDAFLDDPLCFAELKPAALASFLAAAPRLADPVNLQRIRDDLPIYVFSGSDDPVGQELLGVQALIERFREAGIHDIAHDFYSGGRHEMLNEINRAEVRARLLGWISAELDRQEGRFEAGFGHIDSLVN
jgi:hypothetical protein